MELIIVNLIALALVGLIVALYLLVYRPTVSTRIKVEKLSDQIILYQKEVSGMKTALGAVEKRIDAIFVVEPTVKESPNQATKPKDEGIEFTEDNPLDLPKGLKFEVEGGDVNIPPQYS